MARQMASFFEKYDLWLTPTLGEPPVPLGSFEPTGDDEMAGFTRAADFVPFTPLQNATGQPAMSVPLYWNGEDLPDRRPLRGALRRRGHALPAGSTARRSPPLGAKTPAR